MTRGTVCERAYSGAIFRDCPHCGAPAGVHCTALDDYGNRRTRRVPCLGRIIATEIEPPPESAAVDYSEPRRTTPERNNHP